MKVDKILHINFFKFYIYNIYDNDIICIMNIYYVINIYTNYTHFNMYVYNYLC